LNNSSKSVQKSYLFSSFEISNIHSSDLQNDSPSSNNSAESEKPQNIFFEPVNFDLQYFDSDQNYFLRPDYEFLEPGYESDTEICKQKHKKIRADILEIQNEQQKINIRENQVQPTLEIIQENNSELSNSNNCEAKIQRIQSSLFINPNQNLFSRQPILPSPTRKKDEINHMSTKTTQTLSHSSHTIGLTPTNEYSTYEPKALLEKAGLKYTKSGKPYFAQINKKLDPAYIMNMAGECKGDDRITLPKSGIIFGAGFVNNYLYTLNQRTISLLRSRNKQFLKTSSSAICLSSSRFSISELSQKGLLKIKRKNIIPIEGVGSHIVIPSKKMIPAFGSFLGNKICSQFI